MREFFRGWKRKTGVVTLVTACVFAAGWVRSLTNFDAVNFRLSELDRQLMSAGSELRLISRKLKRHEWISFYDSGSVSEIDLSGECRNRYFADGVEKNMLGLRFGHGYGQSDRVTYVFIPYLTVVLPLTLLSAYLLLGKPRLAKKPDTSPSLEPGHV